MSKRKKVADTRLFGIDVSHHQGVISWSQVAAAGVKYAFLKATEASTFKDKSYQLAAKRFFGALGANAVLCYNDLLHTNTHTRYETPLSLSPRCTVRPWIRWCNVALRCFPRDQRNGKPCCAPCCDHRVVRSVTKSLHHVHKLASAPCARGLFETISSFTVNQR
jgi:hypothetical protein